MTVTSANRGDDPNQGGVDREGRTSRVPWVVVVDDKQDTEQTIINYFEQNGPFVGDFYSVGNEIRVDMVCKSIQPRRRDGSRLVWDVTVVYGPPDTDDEEEEGEPNKSPVDFRPRLRVWTSLTEYEANFSKYLGGYDSRSTEPDYVGNAHAALLALPDSRTVPQNSAFFPFLPTKTVTYPVSNIELIRNSLSMLSEDAADWVGLVNDTGFNWNLGYTTFDFEIPKHHGKIMAADSDFRIINGIEHWRHRLVIGYNGLSWVDQIPDRGMHVDARPGGPDGRGGTFPGGQDPHFEPMPRAMAATGVYGHPITEPKLFDGDGRVLAEDEPPVIGRWLHEGEANFLLDIPILSGIIVAVAP